MVKVNMLRLSLYFGAYNIFKTHKKQQLKTWSKLHFLAYLKKITGYSKVQWWKVSAC